MANAPDRADFWKEFSCTKCRYPAPERLRAQFAVATLYDFCPCRCNSFAVKIPADAQVEPIAMKGHHGLVFEADFSAGDEKALETLLFADRDGNLSHIEIDYCANSYPAPDVISVQEPCHVNAKRLLP